MFAAIADAYRRTRKPVDLVFNRYVARPLAAVLVVAVASTRLTPNQLTFGSLGLFVIAAAGVVLMPSHEGLIASVALLELSYVVDMADGQLARYRGTSSPVGAHLDYMADELKALLLVAACAVRLWQPASEPRWLLEGLLGAVTVATAVTLTSFLRRPEVVSTAGALAAPAAGDYGQGLPTTQGPVRGSGLARAARALEAVGKFVVHYPTYLWAVALLDRLDLFLHAYIFMNLAYAGRCLLLTLWRLGRLAPKT